MKFVRREPDKGYLDGYLWAPKSMVNADAVRRALTFDVGPYERILSTKRHEIICWFLVTSSGEAPPFEVVDCRPTSYVQTNVKSKIVLDKIRPNKDTQARSVDAVVGADGGVLQLSCGTGKTVIALHTISIVRVPTLIVVDTTELMRQWKGEIEQFLELDDELGQFGDGVYDWKHSVTLAMYHSLANRANVLPQEFANWFGYVIFEEGHHSAAPIFAKTLPLVPGKRLVITATPKRSDGRNLVYDLHAGPVLYKDIEMDVIPYVRFKKTGITLPDDPEVQGRIVSKTGEVHLGLLAKYLATREDRLSVILEEVRRLRGEGRKVLVLSSSVDVIANLLCAWNGVEARITDIKEPTPAELGYPDITWEPARMMTFEMAEVLAVQKQLERMLTADPARKVIYENDLDIIRARLRDNEAASKINSIVERERNKFIKQYLTGESDAGAMIHKVGSEVRARAIKDKMVTFAIMKYGKEGLNSKELDTVLVCDPITDRNAIQQLLGRPSRLYENKKRPLVIFCEDNIGILIGMCSSIRTTLRKWPVEEGGPIPFDSDNRITAPKAFRRNT